jgi:hypothetical protein
MAWQISGRNIELCSCKMVCPCLFGPEGEPDQGWCSAALGFSIDKGSSDGVDLAGTKVVLAADWPANFFAGNGKARLYIGKHANARQRAELEAIFTGKKGGLLEPLLGAVIAEWLPTEVTDIEITSGDKVTAKVGDAGRVSLVPMKDGAGNQATIRGAAAQAAFQFEHMGVASSKGSRWSDKGLRAWQGDSGTMQPFDWKS